MTKLFKDKSVDADIKVDWQKRTITFENRKDVKKAIHDAIVLSFVAALLFLAIMTYTNYQRELTFADLQTKSVDDLANEYLSHYSTATYPTTLIVAMTVFTSVFVFLIFSLPAFPAYSEKLRKFIVNRRIKNNTFYTYTIPNPSGLLMLDMHGVEPVIDLDFSDAVSEKIESVNLVKIPYGNHDKKKKIQLQIQMKEQANGELVIKEYF